MSPNLISSDFAAPGGLPGEVTDHIFEFLDGDIVSLRASALVSHAWTPYSQTRLFNSFTCRVNEFGRTVADVLAWTATDGKRVLQYIATLVIAASETTWLSPVLRILDIEVLMSRMPNVRRVTLNTVTLQIANHPLPTMHHISRVRSLERLTILYCKTDDDTFQPIGHLLCLFPVIDHLHFADTRCSKDVPVESAPWLTFLLSYLRINDLDIRHSDPFIGHTAFRVLCQICEGAQTRLPLRRLGLSLPLQPSSSPISMLLGRCMRSLVDLRVDVVPSMLFPIVSTCEPSQWRLSTLKECTRLKTLRLNFLTVSYVPNHMEVFHGAYNDVLDANAEIIRSSPLQLRTIILTWLHSGVLDALTVDALRKLTAWSRLDDAIRQLRQLASVTCVIPRDGDWDIETQIELLHSLPMTSCPSDRPVVSIAPSEDEWQARILVAGLPATFASGGLHIFKIH